MKYQLATTCRLGNRKSNQDRFSVVETNEAIMMVIADGMSGHAEGKLAADTVVDSLVRSFNSTQFPHPDPHTFLEQVLVIANREVLDAGSKLSPPVTPRTTCVVCLVQQGTAIWAHVGDSRLYRIRQGKILDRTADHSRVEELYQQGLITAEQKLRHPQRNIVTQCIGSPKKPPRPTISQKTPLSSDDVLLLCSDGLWGQLPEDQIADGFTQKNIVKALEKLAHDAELNGFPKSDNISAVAFHWLSNEKSLSSANESQLDNMDDLNDGMDAMLKTLDEIEKGINK